MAPKPQVFISHSSTDTWVAKQISSFIKRCGARSFLDETDIEIGDDFEEKIREAAKVSLELVVLLTPWALDRPYIWLEMGLFWEANKRIVGLLHGLTAKELAANEKVPAFLKRVHLSELNNIDSYFAQLKHRIRSLE
jgi:hypothetical protein